MSTINRNKMKLYALGPKGSYGHEAALIAMRELALGGETGIRFVDSNVNILPSAESETGTAVIPVENSTYGDVVDVLTYLSQQSNKYPLRIMGQIELPVRHCLLARQEVSSVEDLESVRSHPQALGQCAESITRWGCKTEPANSTAAAAKFVSQHPEVKIGAIASELAAQEYGLKILERDVQTREDNVTRFFVWGPERSTEPSGSDKTVLIFKTPNAPGALSEAIRPFALQNINITSLHSIALGEWSYAFYLEIDGHAAETRVHQALQELREKTMDRWILGSFRKRLSAQERE